MSIPDSWFDMKIACGRAAASSEISIRAGMPLSQRRLRAQLRAQKR